MSNPNGEIRGGELSLRSMKKIIKTYAPHMRVSEDSCRELRNLVENYGKEIAADAINTAENNNRVTVRDTDIVQALKNRGEE